MALKDLFIINDDKEKKESPKTNSKPLFSETKFPEQTKTSQESSSFSVFNVFGSQKQPSQAEISNEHLNTAIELYQNGFDSINQDGYDFYEYYKAVTHGGVDNPQIYTMAFAMGSAMDKTISKDKLIQQSDFYISKINDVYSDFTSKGTSKKSELEQQKNSENQTLLNDLNSLNQQMENLKIQINDRETKLKAIDGKYSPLISDVEGKLSANSIAKDRIIKSIETVKQGIFTNIK